MTRRITGTFVCNSLSSPNSPSQSAAHRKGFVPTGTGGAAAVAFPCMVLGFFGGGGGGGFLPILATNSGAVCGVAADALCAVACGGGGLCTRPCPTPPPGAPSCCCGTVGPVCCPVGVPPSPPSSSGACLSRKFSNRVLTLYLFSKLFARVLAALNLSACFSLKALALRAPD